MLGRPLRKAALTFMSVSSISLAASAVGAGGAAAETIKIGYMKHPIHEASVAIMEKWAQENGHELVKIPMAYAIFQEKVTASLTSGGDQFDIIWHNDDWGQLWKKWVEPLGGLEGMEDVAQTPLDAFYNDDGEVTAVPMAHTVGTFFYRTDLMSEDEVPTTWDELVEVSKRLQDEGKVKWGYVGAMAMNNTWFTLWWSMWSNHCDIFEPIYSRDNEELAANGWDTAFDQPCTEEYMNFWWDAMNTHEISPKSMTAYTRDESNAIFMAGDSAFTLIDSTHFGEFNDPNKSRIAGDVAMAPWPVGPRMDEPVAWNEIWGWAIPKGVPEERKQVAKQMLSAMLTDIEGQVEMWNETGGPPPSTKAWEVLAGQDPVFADLKDAVFDQNTPFHSAYYIPEWPAVHKAYSDVMIGALKGAREDIPKALAEGAQTVSDAAQGK